MVSRGLCQADKNKLKNLQLSTVRLRASDTHRGGNGLRVNAHQKYITHTI